MKTKFEKLTDKGAFTLLELMIVLLITGILMSGVFMLMSVAAKFNRIARTKSRMEKVQNAISGFYSAYGTYPPVELHNKTDPFSSFTSDFEGGSAVIDGSSSLNPEACRMACRAQPVSFEFPYSLDTDDVVNELYRDIGILGANGVYANAARIPESDWNDVKMFKFGLMSFLLPRIQLTQAPSAGGGFSQDNPIAGFYQSQQWRANNKTSTVGGAGDMSNLIRSLNTQRVLENREAAKWLPNLEGVVSGYAPTIFNIDLSGGGYMGDPDLDGTLNARFQESEEPVGHHHPFRGPYSKGGAGSETVLYCSTVKDAWNRDLFYYSAPPYQSYRLWSSGPDGKTFPPWIPLQSISNKAYRDEIAGWIEDDIVGFDR